MEWRKDKDRENMKEFKRQGGDKKFQYVSKINFRDKK